MDLFKLVGSIFINNKEANSQIDETNTKAQNLATKIGSVMETAGNKITGLGKAIAPVSAVLATALTTSTKSASDFQNGMAKMSTLFDTSKTSVSDLSKEFLTLSNKTGLSASELAEAGYQALSAGQSVDKVGKFVETAGNLAKAGFTSTTTAVDVLTTTMNAYLADYPNTNTQVIEFGSNLLDFTHDMVASDIVTAVIPLGARLEDVTEVEGLDAYLTIKDVNGGVDYVYSQEAVKSYGWIFKTVKWDDVHVADNLLKKGKEYLTDIQFAQITLTVSAVDLHMLHVDMERIKVLDRIRVTSTPNLVLMD